MLKLGSKGPEVSALQHQLGLPADGDFGPLTQDAVKRFQADNHLQVDGIVGILTYNMLMKPAQPLPSSPHFPPKCTTLAAAEARYGHIDWASKHWADQSKWIKSLVIPEGWFPYWKVLDTDLPVRAISCNIDIHGPLSSALEQLHIKGLADQLQTFDGCLNIRPVRGSTRPSTHSYGLGLDINSAANPMGPVLHTNMSAEFVKCFTDQGFAWGGNFHTRKDPMHYSRCWEG